MTGYVANAIGQEPTATVLGISLVRFGTPVIMAFIAIVALLKYPAKNEK